MWLVAILSAFVLLSLLVWLLRKAKARDLQPRPPHCPVVGLSSSDTKRDTSSQDDILTQLAVLERGVIPWET